jgi:DNA-binding transcriptional regulator YhcF (GntR family)
MPGTTKKISVIGTETYINQSTGEIEEFNVIKSEDSDFDFDKLWTAQILLAIDEFGNQKTKLLMHLIKIRERSNNAVIRTVMELANETGMNKNTVSATLKILQKHRIITRKTGVIFISPEVVYRGSHSNRMRVLIDYRSTQKNQNDEETEEAKQLKPAPVTANLKDMPGFAVKEKSAKKSKVRIKEARA